MVETSDGFAAGFTCSNTDAIVHRQYKNLSIADFALITAATTGNDRVDRGLDKLFIDRDLQLDFSQQVHARIVSAMRSGSASLAAESLALKHSQSNYLDFAERRFDGLKFAGLDDGDDKFHSDVWVRTRMSDFRRSSF